MQHAATHKLHFFYDTRSINEKCKRATGMSSNMSYLCTAPPAHGCHACRSCSSTASLQLQRRPLQAPTLAGLGCGYACPTTAHDHPCHLCKESFPLVIEAMVIYEIPGSTVLECVSCNGVKSGLAYPLSRGLTESPGACLDASESCSLLDLRQKHSRSTMLGMMAC